MTTIEELKPCPFCGSTKIESINDDGLFWKRCTSCGATGPELTKYSGEEDESCNDWNTRPFETALQQKYDMLLFEVKAAIEDLKDTTCCCSRSRQR